MSVNAPTEGALALLAASTQSTQFKVTYVTADTIGVEYTTMPNNLPNTYGNFLAIWQNDQVGWDLAPSDPIQVISTNSQQGSATFSGLTIADLPYTVGYAVGPVRTASQLYANVCAGSYVPAGSQGNNSPFSSTVTLVYLGSTSVAVNVNLPAGCLPKTNGAWLGLWRGEVASYLNPPDYSVPVNLNGNTGSVGFNNVRIGVGLNYTIGLYMTGWSSNPAQLVQKSLASSLTFTGGSGS